MSLKSIEKSFNLQERAKKRIPGLSQLLSKRPDMFSYGVWPGYFSKAKGAYVWDLDGNKYLDMSIGGIGANVLGYADLDVNAAVKEAIAKGTSCSLNCPEEVELADLLCELHPWAEQVRYTRTGGESMAVAVRIARAATGKDKIAFCGYHGWHDWYLSANIGTENALGEHLIAGLNPTGVPKALANTAHPFSFNDVDQLESIAEQYGQDMAAIVMEPIRNIEPEKQFIEKIHELKEKYNCVLIIDEISAGLRMNTGGAHLEFGYKPDMAVFSKALGNGYPIAAIIGKKTVMEAAQKSFISSTYWTERIGPVAAIAVLRKHKEKNVGDYLMEMGNAIQQCWNEMSDKFELPIHVSGIPPLSHFEFEGEQSLELKALFIQEMLEKNILASNSFYSMYAHTDEHVEQYSLACENAFKSIKSAIEQGDVRNRLKGKPSVSGFKRLN